LHEKEESTKFTAKDIMIRIRLSPFCEQITVARLEELPAFLPKTSTSGPAVTANKFPNRFEGKRRPLIVRRLQRVVIRRSYIVYYGISYVTSIRRDLGPVFGEPSSQRGTFYKVIHAVPLHGRGCPARKKGQEDTDEDDLIKWDHKSSW
jgi:hypothetical protein